MNRNSEGPGWSLCAGIMMLICGTLSITTDKPLYRTPTGHYIALVDWIGWVLLPSGIVISIVSIRALLRGGWKPKKYNDEEVARAKEELDRMYLQEHGYLPKEHGSLLKETDHKKDA